MSAAHLSVTFIKNSKSALELRRRKLQKEKKTSKLAGQLAFFENNRYNLCQF